MGRIIVQRNPSINEPVVGVGVVAEVGELERKEIGLRSEDKSVLTSVDRELRRIMYLCDDGRLFLSCLSRRSGGFLGGHFLSADLLPVVIVDLLRFFAARHRE